MAKKEKHIKKKGQKKKAKPTAANPPSNWEQKKPVLQFAGLFLLGCIIFYAISGTSWFESFRQPLLHFFASGAAFFLGIFEPNVTANGETLSSPRFAVEIREGCDAIAPLMLFSLSVLFYPVSWNKRLKGIAFGIIAIFVLNLIRIISLYIVGVHAPSWFEFMHVDFWQVGFILFTIVIWIYWMRWATQIKAL